MDVQRAVMSFMQRERLSLPGARIVVGVSGGPDSLCLLHVLCKCQEDLGIELHVAHLNHMIRGTDADEDAAFVADRAAGWHIPCTVEACDVPAIAEEHKLALEEAARRARYAFLYGVARTVGATRVAVAHNADDQSETVLMHWLRGAGLAGLRGMVPAVRMAELRLFERPEEANDLWLIRPLLEVPRADVERYCQEHDLEPRFDRSNLDTTLYRNKLRHELLPYLEREYKPRFREILRRSAQVARDDYDLLCELRDRAWQETVQEACAEAVILERGAWRALHPSLQRATVRHAVRHLRWNLRDVNFVHVEAAVQVAREGDVGAQATLSRNVVLTVGYDTIVIADAAFSPPVDWPALDVDRLSLSVPGMTPLPGGGFVQIGLVSPERMPADWARNTDRWRAFLDADVVGTAVCLRRRQDADRFCPLGLGGRHKLVSELLVNEKVPAQWRDQVPLLVRGDGEIMWVCGWRVDERARVTEDTAQVMAVCLRVGEVTDVG
jgi:tRNA(Ile)-lysidine synthase